MAAHRYWRLFNMISASGGFLSIAEVALCTTIGGATVTGSGTATANATATNTPGTAFDGVKTGSNMWTAGNPNGPDWLAYDFGSGNAFDIVQVVISGRNDGNPTYSPSRFRMQWSNDGTAWTDATVDITPATWVTNVDQSFTLASFPPPPPPDPTIAHRYWRLGNMINSPSGSGPAFTSISEIALCTSIGGATVTGSGTPSTSGDVTNTAATMFNGNKTDTWTGTGLGAWVQYDFGSGITFKIVSVVMSPRPDDPRYTPCYFDLECSDDGTAWSTVQGFFPLDWAAGVDQTFNVGNQVAGRYWRLANCVAQNGNPPKSSEIQLRATVGGSSVAVGGRPNASSGQGAANLFDGSTANEWDSFISGSSPPVNITYDFGATMNIVQVQIYPAVNSTDVPASIKTFDLQSSPDGFTWATTASFTAATWVTSVPQTFTVPGAGVSPTAPSRSLMM